MVVRTNDKAVCDFCTARVKVIIYKSRIEVFTLEQCVFLGYLKFMFKAKIHGFSSFMLCKSIVSFFSHENIKNYP